MELIEVNIADPKDRYELVDWAIKYCPDFQAWEIVDVSDVSLSYDEICTFKFRSEKDANWFRLRWA